MKSFCPHCGAQSTYSGSKPKFCGSCGDRLDSISISHKKGQPEKEQDDEGTPNVPEPHTEKIPDINGLDVEVQSETPRTFTLGQVFESYSNVEPSSQSSQPSPPQKISKKEFREQFKKEAGTLRPRK